MSQIEKAIKGCIVGGAIGDALGFEVEFCEDFQIFKRFGEDGITQLQLHGGVAPISDDTQMTLFTADGMIAATRRYQRPTVDEFTQCVYNSYLDWLYTQDHAAKLDESRAHSRLLEVKELHQMRAPGTTCLNALYSGRCGTIAQRINRSKGCGGIMRVAPVPLVMAQMGYGIDEIALVSASTAAITHGHDLGIIPTAYLGALLAFILQGESLSGAAKKTTLAIKRTFDSFSEVDRCLELVGKAIELASPQNSWMNDLDALRLLGLGWVAEETLAIALFCALRYSGDYQKAIIAAANHSGDSDSTAAVTGNILGAYLGIDQIPPSMIEPIECRQVILELCDEMLFFE